MLDLWFEIILTVYGAIYLFLYLVKLGFMISSDEPPPINEEVMRRLYV